MTGGAMEKVSSAIVILEWRLASGQHNQTSTGMKSGDKYFDAHNKGLNQLQ